MSKLIVFPYDAAVPSGAPHQRPRWRKKRVLVAALLVALLSVGCAGGNDKESPEALLSVTNADESKTQAASAEAARDLAAAQAAAEQAAADRAAAEAAAEEAAEAKAAAEAAALAAQKAAADRAAAEKAAADQAAAERAAAEKVAADRAAAQRAAAQKAAAQPQPLAAAPKGGAGCTPEYPDFCIPPAADYNCPDFSQKNFTALAPDPYRLDGNDKDGIACESR
jgi:hypothetical protein